MSNTNNAELAYAKILQMDDYIGQTGIKCGMSPDEISSRLKDADLLTKAEGLFGKGVHLRQYRNAPLTIEDVSPDRKKAFEGNNEHFYFDGPEGGPFRIIVLDAPKSDDLLDALDFCEGADFKKSKQATEDFLDLMTGAIQIDVYHFNVQTGDKSEQSDVPLYHIALENDEDFYLVLRRDNTASTDHAYEGIATFPSIQFKWDLSGNTFRGLDSLDGMELNEIPVSVDKITEFRQMLRDNKDLIRDYDVDVCYGVSENNEKNVYLVTDGKAAEMDLPPNYKDDGANLTYDLMHTNWAANGMIDFLEGYGNVLSESDFSFQGDKSGCRTVVVGSKAVKLSVRKSVPSEWEDMAAGNGMQDTNDKDYGD